MLKIASLLMSSHPAQQMTQAIYPSLSSSKAVASA